MVCSLTLHVLLKPSVSRIYSTIILNAVATPCVAISSCFTEQLYGLLWVL